MSSLSRHASSVYNLPPDELVLVVKRELLFEYQEAWHGIKQCDYAHYETLIRKHQEFLPRARMETDTRYKQIIPYLVFTHQGEYFVVERLATSTEQRLKNKLSLGIGGHINPADLQGATTMIDWTQREFKEEVDYAGQFTVEPIGLLNDDTNEVGRVHIGVIYLLHGTSPHIKHKEEFKSGTLLALDACLERYNQMEPWSQMVIDWLMQRTLAA